MTRLNEIKERQRKFDRMPRTDFECQLAGDFEWLIRRVERLEELLRTHPVVLAHKLLDTIRNDRAEEDEK